MRVCLVSTFLSYPEVCYACYKSSTLRHNYLNSISTHPQLMVTHQIARNTTLNEDHNNISITDVL
jgi:hypothetical protein